MKAALYTIRTDPQMGSNFQWHYFISLDMRVDLHYWYNRYPNAILYQMEPPVSLGIAVTLQEKLYRNSPKLSAAPTQQSDSPTQQWVECIRSKAEECRISPQLLQQIHFQKIKLPPPHHSAATPDPAYIKWLSERLQGRAVLHEELMDLLSMLDKPHVSNHWRGYIQHLYLNQEINIVNGISCKSKRKMQKLFFFSNSSQEYECQRCGSGRNKMYWTYCESCENECPYCEECLNMGRTRFCSLLIHSMTEIKSQTAGNMNEKVVGLSNRTAGSLYPSPASSYSDSLYKWKLSKPQQEAAILGLTFLKDSLANVKNSLPNGTYETPPQLVFSDKRPVSPSCFLIWAVTGAGKTEIIFPIIEAELNRGGKVLVATPRRDVVLELQPRLQKAFPNHTLVTLYGGSLQRWETGDLTLATTHQLLRFKHKFDLIIIDEIDAFPFHFNPMLEYAVQKSCSHQGRYILLSATPPAHLQKAAKTNKLPYAKVSVRFHGYPLPVPRQIRMKTAHSTQVLPRTLLSELKDSLQKEAQIFIFVPRIKLIEPLVLLLRNQFKDIAIDGTSSQDPDRTEKVQQFRQGHIQILITTTILERGVTVPKTDVLILNADAAIYTESALVQMAGRSGRASTDPIGKVCFFAQDKTHSQVRAIRQIKDMNRLARKKGYLIPQKEEKKVVSNQPKPAPTDHK
jgi:competence protein ComFA